MVTRFTSKDGKNVVEKQGALFSNRFLLNGVEYYRNSVNGKCVKFEGEKRSEITDKEWKRALKDACRQCRIDTPV